MGDLVQDLRQSAEELIETHISWVLLHQDEVFKIKKPVNFGFLDFSELEARRRACLAEVVLNARLAPGVYRGVVAVTRDDRGMHAIGGTGQVVDYAVHMQRLPKAARADILLERGQLAPEQVEALAELLARFHERATHDAHVGEFGRVEVIRKNVEENFAQAGAVLAPLAPDGTEREIETRQLAFLDTRGPLFDARIAAGRIRDGHGDLRLEHVYLVDGAEPVVIDCIEFNERFRFADVCADIAFLSMDLAWHGRPDLKERFLAAYVRASGDDDLYALVDFYESYRAYVRAKVCAISLGARSLSFGERDELERSARRYLLLALAAERPSLLPPRMIAIGGIIASGKSSVAGALGRRLGVPVISSDQTRKRLLGVAPTTSVAGGPWRDAYSAEKDREVYAEVLRRARVVLDSGRSVVVDASFRSRTARRDARDAAHAAGATFCFIECRASDAAARARLEARAHEPSISDARIELYDEFVARYEPVSELPPEEHLIVDTTGSLEESLGQLERAGLATAERPL